MSAESGVPCNALPTALEIRPNPTADTVPHPASTRRYPKLRRLLDLKQDLVDRSATPSTYLAADLRHSLRPPPPHSSHHGLTKGDFHLASLMPVKYDVVLIDAPLSCYEWDSVPSASHRLSNQTWSWEEVSQLPIPLLAAKER